MIEINCNVQFEQLLASNKRFRVHQGGTRSGKTFAICQYLTYLIRTSDKPLTISIIRKTLPAIKGSVMRDMIKVLTDANMYHQCVHNKAENTIQYGKHMIEFLSIDQPQKIRGRSRDIAFLNESNELDLEDFRQINMRTRDFVIIDFNPSDPVHWLYNEVIPRDDCDTWITTYKDNKFLQSELIMEIERMRERDPDFWRVYGEGQRAFFSKRQIFSGWEFRPFDEFPEMDNPTIGIDFGFSNDPTAILIGQRINGTVYVHELMYKTGQTNQDIADFLHSNDLNDVLAYADSAEPKSIVELRQMGCLIKECKKGQGSINAGISLIKEYDVVVSEESKNMQTEYNSYYWEQMKDGTIINKPVDKMNHLCDAFRYMFYSQYSTRNEFFVI